MAVESILGWIAAENGVIFLDDPDQPLIQRQISCVNVNPQAIVWLVPRGADERVQGYEPIIQTLRPTADALKTIKVEDYENHNVFYIAIDDSVVFTDFAANCNECCGPTPAFAKPTIPVPIIEEKPCPTVPPGTAVYKYDFPLPQNPNTLNYSLQGSFNGAYATPTPSAGGYANAAAVLAFVQGSWGAYGTWTLTAGNTILHMESTTSITGDVQIGLVPADYCMDIPSSPATIDSLVVDGVTITFSPVTLSRTSPQAAFYAIRPYLVGTLEIVISGGHNKFHYLGTQVPVSLKNGASVIATFSAGVCP